MAADCPIAECDIQIENGIDLFNRLSVLLRIYPTGSDSLDEVLDGGVWTGEVTEIVGTSSAGKTQLCYSLTASVLLRAPGTSVLYLDSNGSFRPKRLAQILKGLRQDIMDEVTEAAFLYRCLLGMFQDLNSYLSRVVIQRPTDSSELLSCLENITKVSRPRNVRVLIVDSAACLLALTVLGERSGWHVQSLVCQMLKNIASELAMAVVVVNHLLFPWKGHPRPALGQWWASLAHVRIRLSKLENSNGELTVKVLKSIRKESGTRLTIRITESGMQDVQQTSPDSNESGEKAMEVTIDTDDYEGDSPTL